MNIRNLIFRGALPVATLLLALLALPAAAQDLGELRSLDADGNQTISAEEARLAAKRQFTQIDANHDGKLSEAEFVDSRLAALSALDTDGDGGVSRAEMRARFMEARKR